MRQLIAILILHCLHSCHSLVIRYVANVSPEPQNKVSAQSWGERAPAITVLW